MKPAFLALAFALMFVEVGSAQKPRKFEPEYLSVFYGLGDSGQAIELERQIPNYILKGSKVLLVIPGEKSPVRFNAGSQMQFVVHVTEDFDKAIATMQLLRFEVQHGKRQLLVKRPAKNENFLGNGLKLNVEKYGSSSLKLVPSEGLPPGEYCVSRTTIHQGFCFGVDAVGNQQALP